MRALLASKISDARMSAFNVAMARYGLSQVDRQENNLELSLKGLDQVIKHFPEQPMLLVDKAVVLGEMGNYNEAKILLEKVQTLEPYNMYATFNLAKLLNKLGQNEKSLKLFNRVSYQIPEFSEVYFEMGRILAQQGKSNESRYYLGKFNLYEGKLKLAEANFRQASTAADVDNQIKQDSQEMLALIKRS
jgi:predicted Zn-dependent protease